MIFPKVPDADRRSFEARVRRGLRVVYTFCHPEGYGRSLLPSTIRLEIDLHTWTLQDGYGEAGYIPEQGWEWRGYRDSSPVAILRMAGLIRATLKDHGLQHLVFQAAGEEFHRARERARKRREGR